MPDRVPFSQISSVAWEHPADRAALKSLRSLPGFDMVARKVARMFGERGIRNLFLGDAVLVGPTQRPQLYALYQEVLQTLDWPGDGRPIPELYVTQTPIANAGAVGFEKPFIVLSSGALELLDREEQRFLLAHEVGHLISGHALYRTLATLIVFFGVGALGMIALVALLPFQYALMEWYRKSELSADRAGLLGTQDPRASMMVFLKLAGGKAGDDSLDVDAFLAQAAEFEVSGSGWDCVHRALDTATREHPFHTVRAAELNRWSMSAEYSTILSGTYARRGEEAAWSAVDEAIETESKESGDIFSSDIKSEARAAANSMEDAFERASDTVGDVVKNAADTLGDVVSRASEGLEDVVSRASGAFKDAFRAASSAARAAEDRMYGTASTATADAPDPVAADYESPATTTDTGASTEPPIDPEGRPTV